MPELPPDKVVLEILEDVMPSAPVLARCRSRATGYRFALDISFTAPSSMLLELADFVRLDIRALGLAEAGRQADLMRGRALKILAEKVETREEFTACRSLPFQYFQGYYFARPETLGMKRIDPSMLRVMKLFNRVIGGAEPGLIEAEFRQDVALAYNLLRFINSAGFGLTHKVHDIKHALVVLGHAKLARWLSLLLLSGARAQAASSALFRTALTRARMTELLGRNRLPPGEHDYLFMTGMFSLLEALLERPLPETLASLNLPPAVAEALLAGRGRYALLQITPCEIPDTDGRTPTAGPTQAEINAAELEALGWAERSTDGRRRVFSPSGIVRKIVGAGSTPRP